MKNKTAIPALAAVLALVATSAFGAVKIGVTPGALADSIEVAAREAREKGLEVEVVEFSDWTTPNLALANGDLDANYFQHQAFLDNAVKETGYELKSVALGILPNIGLYSEKHVSLEALPDGARVAVANDPVNQGRGLVLLQAAGLIALRPDVGWKATLDDITANPRNLQFVEIEGPQLVRAVSDVDLAQGYPAHYVNAGRDDFAGRALLYSGLDDIHFAIRFVTRVDNADDPEIAEFIRIYQSSQAVRDRIDASNAHNPALYSLPWLSQTAAN
ncbi:MetQ/NlpA family ABC transporter substrate-binding protein [Paracoccus kondratievae]|uniref:Metal ABC transporter substrate-binding protein n=1 Tax=Paracoccus kondratievae TaxID=135740 RepID=A0AAD3P1A4_9RHOB|nr:MULTISPECIES: MetQ/NlpA family ABC transporter substrate-binding protein [Paracoccus]QFQ89253.1 MetQ/NlpA family ABC transporter substrate-binding protein [Paracoccus kondratievae]GLK65028.1 metal ABC transporter substrate-binding protein [Paracoccus kondratievae]SMG55038.1 D-methionine transport system substrate-binding protein [Paracoccus sp. J56]